MRALFLVKEYFVFILAAVILCFPVVRWIGNKLKSNKRLFVIYDALIAVVVLGLFVCAVAFLVAGKNNPFAYANF